MKKILGILVTLVTLASMLLPVAVFAAGPVVSFEVVRVGPTSVTIEAVITGLLDGTPVSVELDGMSCPVSDIRVYEAETVDYEEKLPVLAERPLTEAEKAAILADDAKAVLPKTITDVVDYETVKRQCVDTMPVLLSADRFTGSSKTYLITVNMPVAAHGDGYGSAGVLKLVINGKEYYDMTHSSWWDQTWLYRLPIEADNTGRGPLSGFPVMIKLEEGVNFTHADAQTNGEDIRFTDDDDNELPFEIESWNDTGVSVLWVAVDLPNNDTTDILMYYGNGTCSDGQNVADTWDDNYVFVCHMADYTDTSHVLDSINGNNGTKTGAANPAEAVGPDGNCQDFDGATAKITVGTAAVLNVTSAATVEVYFKQQQAGADDSKGLYCEMFSITTTGRILYQRSNWEVRMYTVGAAVESRMDLPSAPYNDTTNWQNLTWTYDGGTNAFLYYKNGVKKLDAVNVGASPLPSGNIGYQSQTPSFRIGEGRSGNLIDALEDEIRVSNIVRSDDWIAATYASEANTLVNYSSPDIMPVVTTELPDVSWESGSGGNVFFRGTVAVGSYTPSCYFEYGATTGYGQTTTPITASVDMPFGYQLRGLGTGTIHVRAVCDFGDDIFYGVDRVITFKHGSIFGIIPLLLVLGGISLGVVGFMKGDKTAALFGIVLVVAALLLLPSVLSGLSLF